MNGFTDYHSESDADDEYERSMKSPAVEGEFSSSSTMSEDPPSAEQTPTFNRTGQTSPSGVVTKWSADQCADWIAGLGFDKYADSFVDEGINGEALIELQHEELQDLNIESIGHRLTILRNIYDLKVRQNVPVLPDHYIPLSSDANAPDSHATQDDVARIIKQIQLRDERLMAAEEDLRTLRDDLNRALEESRRLREDVLPVLRMAKDKNQPLPTPEMVPSHNDTLPSPQSAVNPDGKSAGLSRKYSSKKLFLGAQGKMPSPTIHESSNLDPSAAAKAASSQLTASMSSSSQPSPRISQQPSPTSPPYLQQGQQQYRGAPSSRYAASTAEEPWTHSNASTLNQTINQDRPPPSRRGPTSSTATSSTPIADEMQQTRYREKQSGNDAASAAGMEFMKSFRVSMEEPCYKVLPVALRKYQIEDDWRQYSLYIVHGDQERCLGLNEKPLILFKQLASEGKKPMFMLRKHAAPQEGFNHDRSDLNSAGPAGVGSLSASSGGLSAQGRQSYASTVQLPGGVL